MAAGNPMQTPPFLTKLYQLVNDPQTSALVSWTDEKGLSFTVHKPSEFGRDILPRYFKHNNFSSFVRQLNQYGFHKQNPDKWMFGHDSFRKDRPDLLKNITRRRPKQANSTSNAVLPHSLAHKAVVELGHYGIEGELKALKRDKDVLIQELVVTRRNEEQLRDKCTSLEGRVSTLEDSSKQMQAFIMHYFSQVLQPYSQAMASRKRKRLPPSSPSSDIMDITVEPPETAVANVSHSPPNPSVDALRAMMQQMGVAMPATPSPPRSASPNASIVERPTDGTAFAPATIQELPQDDQTNGGASTAHLKRSVPRIGPPLPNGKPPNRSNGAAQPRPARKRTPQQPTRRPAPSATQRTPQLDAVAPSTPHLLAPSTPNLIAPSTPNLIAPSTPNLIAPSTPNLLAPSTPNLPNASPLFGTKLLSSPNNTSAIAKSVTHVPKTGTAPTNEMSTSPDHEETDPALEFLANLPNTPTSNMSLDLIDTVLGESKSLQVDGGGLYHANSDTDPHIDFSPEYEITFTTNETNDSHVPTCPDSNKEDEKTLEDFLELSGDDQLLPPPLTHLPEGTDIHALAKRIESFADAAED